MKGTDVSRRGKQTCEGDKRYVVMGQTLCHEGANKSCVKRKTFFCHEGAHKRCVKGQTDILWIGKQTFSEGDFLNFILDFF